MQDKYIQLKEAATQQQEGSNEPTPINEAQLYYEVVGGQKKSWVYGLGSQTSAYHYKKTVKLRPKLATKFFGRYIATNQRPFCDWMNEIIFLFNKKLNDQFLVVNWSLFSDQI